MGYMKPTDWYDARWRNKRCKYKVRSMVKTAINEPTNIYNQNTSAARVDRLLRAMCPSCEDETRYPSVNAFGEFTCEVHGDFRALVDDPLSKPFGPNPEPWLALEGFEFEHEMLSEHNIPIAAHLDTSKIQKVVQPRFPHEGRRLITDGTAGWGFNVGDKVVYYKNDYTRNEFGDNSDMEEYLADGNTLVVCNSDNDNWLRRGGVCARPEGSRVRHYVYHYDDLKKI